MRRAKASPTTLSEIGAEQKAQVASADNRLADARLGDTRLGKGDPNLFLRPWIALWRRNEKTTVINLEWEEDHPSIAGRKIKASWKVTGDPELGLPMSGDRRLFNVLCELTREQGLAQSINFTRYDVLRRLGRASGKRDYELLLHSFERLKAVKITARNVFRDARTGLIEDAVFSIIDDVTIIKAGKSGKIEPDELPLSTFSWSDRIYSNIQNGFLLTFDLNVVQSLRSDVALVLYPLLLAKTYDGPGRRRSHFHSELRDFYENHLGMRGTPYLSKMEERLLPAHEELKQIGFLADARIEPMKAAGQHKITYTLNIPEAAALPTAATEKLQEEKRPPTPRTSEDVLDPVPALAPAEADNLLGSMIGIGVDGDIARQVLKQHPLPSIRLHLDCLADRKPRDLAAMFLYAVRRDLAPPPLYLERVARERQREAEQAQSALPQAEAEQARATAAQAWADKEALRRQLGSATAFYEGLCDEARALVRQRVSGELKQGGVKGRWQYPQPLWMEVLCGLLRNQAWQEELELMRQALPEASQEVDSVEHNAHEEQEEEESQEAILLPSSLFARLDLYADTLREMVCSGEVKAQALDSIKERAFPLLDAQEWQSVKERALSAS